MSTNPTISIEDLFHEAAALPLAERARFLDDRCAGDSEVRRRLVMLLEAHDEDDNFLPSQPTTSAIPLSEIRDTHDQLAGARIGPYEIRRLIGFGGMGGVYEAQQDVPRRLVALKLLRAGLSAPQAARRLRHEAQILGELRHPGIAQVYGAGIDSITNGPRAGERQPYIAMELIQGRPIDAYVRDHRITLRGRFDLVAKVADAVHHAHEKGIIHRDLKPGNILVDEFGQPKVLDFGVARIVNPDIQVTMQTEAGQIVGTLAYMSPEQVAGRSEEQDVRTDVYSLGILLYELITGKSPYNLKGCTIPEAARVIREEEPSRLRSIDSSCRGDVETIVAKAMEKDRARRYQSAADLAADIRRYLHDEPLVARPASTFYRMKKYVRRHKAAVGIMVALAIGLVGTAGFGIHAEQQRHLADERATLLQREAYLSNLAAARGALIAHDTASAVRYLDACPDEMRGWEWYWRRGLYTETGQALSLGPDDVVDDVGGDTVVIHNASGNYRVLDIASEREIQRFQLNPNNVQWCELTSNGDAVAFAFHDGLAILDVGSGRERWRTSHRHAVACGPMFSGDGRVLAAPAIDSPGIQLLDAHTGKLVRHVRTAARSRGVALSPDASTIHAFPFTNEDQMFLDAGTGHVLWSGNGSRCVFSADGRQVILCFAPNWIAEEHRIHDARSGRLLKNLEVRDGSAMGAAYRPDSSLLATVEHVGEITLRDTRSFEIVSVIRQTGDTTRYLHFGRDGETLYGWTRNALRVFSGVPDPNPMIVQHRFIGEVLSRRRISPDGRSVACSDWGTMTVFDAEQGGCRWTRFLGTREYAPFAFHPDSARVAAVTTGRRVTLFDVSTGDPVSTSVPLQCAEIVNFDWTPDGRFLLAITNDREIRILDGRDLSVIKYDWPRPAPPEALMLTESEAGVVLCQYPDVSEVLLPAHSDASLRFRRVPLAETVRNLACIAVNPARTHFAAGDRDGHIHLWDLRTGRHVFDIAADSDTIEKICFNGDGTRLAATTRARLVLVDTDRRERVDLVPGLQREGRAIRFAPRDRALIISALGRPVVRLEIRGADSATPKATIAARELNRRAAAVVATIGGNEGSILDEVIDRISAATELSAELRSAALEFARGLGEQPNWLNSTAWGIARDPGRSIEAYRRAVTYVQAALKHCPEDFAFLNTLGAAQYRAGEFEAAIATMRRADAAFGTAGLNGRPHGRHPSNGVISAMALARLGRLQEARKALKDVREQAKMPEFQGDAELAAFLLEADELVSP